MDKSFDFTDQVALALAERGAEVVITSRKLDACEAVAAEIEAMGRKAIPGRRR